MTTIVGVAAAVRQWPRNWTMDINGVRLSGYGQKPDWVEDGLELEVIYASTSKDGKTYNNIGPNGISKIAPQPMKTQVTLPTQAPAQNAAPAQPAAPTTPQRTPPGMTREERKLAMGMALEDAKEVYTRIMGPIDAGEERAVVAMASTFYIQARQDERDNRRR